MAARKRTKRTEKVPKSVGANMRKWRIAQGMTLIQVADLLGVTKGHLSQVETGDGNLSLPLFLAYCKQIKVPASRILEDGLMPKNRDFERLAEMLVKAVGSKELAWLAELSKQEADVGLAAARDAVDLHRLRKRDRIRHKGEKPDSATIHRMKR